MDSTQFIDFSNDEFLTKREFLSLLDSFYEYEQEKPVALFSWLETMLNDEGLPADKAYEMAAILNQIRENRGSAGYKAFLLYNHDFYPLFRADIAQAYQAEFDSLREKPLWERINFYLDDLEKKGFYSQYFIDDIERFPQEIAALKLSPNEQILIVPFLALCKKDEPIPAWDGKNCWCRLLLNILLNNVPHNAYVDGNILKILDALFRDMTLNETIREIIAFKGFFPGVNKKTHIERISALKDVLVREIPDIFLSGAPVDKYVNALLSSRLYSGSGKNILYLANFFCKKEPSSVPSEIFHDTYHNGYNMSVIATTPLFLNVADKNPIRLLKLMIVVDGIFLFDKKKIALFGELCDDMEFVLSVLLVMYNQLFIVDCFLLWLLFYARKTGIASIPEDIADSLLSESCHFDRKKLLSLCKSVLKNDPNIVIPVAMRDFLRKVIQPFLENKNEEEDFLKHLNNRDIGVSKEYRNRAELIYFLYRLTYGNSFPLERFFVDYAPRLWGDDLISPLFVEQNETWYNKLSAEYPGITRMQALYDRFRTAYCDSLEKKSPLEKYGSSPIKTFFIVFVRNIFLTESAN